MFEGNDQISEIWKEGVCNATTKILLRKQHVSVESILFDAWSDTIKKAYAALGYHVEKWVVASKKEKIISFRNKMLAFENFQEDAFDRMKVSPFGTG